jgi:putative endonuclease
MPFFVYILYSGTSGKYYIGQTANLTDRLNRHNNGYEKFTSPYTPWKMIWFTEKSTRGEALILEKKLKNLSRERILKFIEKYSQ